MRNGLVSATVVLAALPAADDQISLRAILGPTGCSLHFVRNLQEGRGTLHSLLYVSVLLTDSSLDGEDSWKHLLDESRTLADPPPVIVASRQADDSLWAEILSVGCYDLLAKPFQKGEVLRVLSSACLSRNVRPYQMTA